MRNSSLRGFGLTLKVTKKKKKTQIVSWIKKSLISYYEGLNRKKKRSILKRKTSFASTRVPTIKLKIKFFHDFLYIKEAYMMHTSSFRERAWNVSRNFSSWKETIFLGDEGRGYSKKKNKTIHHNYYKDRMPLNVIRKLITFINSSTWLGCLWEREKTSNHTCSY